MAEQTAHHIDDLRPGAKVMTSDGEQVGTLYDVLVDANDDQLTHVIVNAGPHFPAIGWGAPTLLSVPIEEMEHVNERAVSLR